MNPQEEYTKRRILEQERSKTRKQKQYGINAARKQKIHNQTCRVCYHHKICNTFRLEAHHMIHKSYLGSNHPLIHHPDNIIPICHSCHQNHHTTSKKIPRIVLTPQEVLFLTRNTRESWRNKWYPNTSKQT